jgi:hypothetical protein
MRRLRRASEDHNVRVIVLSAAGEHFSGGHDLGSKMNSTTARRDRWKTGCAGATRISREHFVDKTLRWRELPKPTLAAVQGYCIFAGWMVASAMDIIFAADDAMFLAANFQYFSIPWTCIRGARKSFCTRAASSMPGRPPNSDWSTAWCRAWSSWLRRSNTRTALLPTTRFSCA